VTLNPIASAIFAAFALEEAITINLVIGFLLVAVGIATAASNASR
jgi:drug/metabolite transporter (DMT)-like permease